MTALAPPDVGPLLTDTPPTSAHGNSHLSGHHREKRDHAAPFLLAITGAPQALTSALVSIGKLRTRTPVAA